MSVPAPTEAQISALAAELGYAEVASDPGEYTTMIAGMLGVYDAVAAVPEPPLLPGRGPVDHHVPTR